MHTQNSDYASALIALADPIDGKIGDYASALIASLRMIERIDDAISNADAAKDSKVDGALSDRARAAMDDLRSALSESLSYAVVVEPPEALPVRKLTAHENSRQHYERLRLPEDRRKLRNIFDAILADRDAVDHTVQIFDDLHGRFHADTPLLAMTVLIEAWENLSTRQQRETVRIVKEATRPGPRSPPAPDGLTTVRRSGCQGKPWNKNNQRPRNGSPHANSRTDGTSATKPSAGV